MVRIDQERVVITDSVWMGLRVCKRQGATPAAAEDKPLFNLQEFPDLFDVFHQVPSSVVFQRSAALGSILLLLGMQTFSLREAATATTLVDKHHTIHSWVKKLPV